MGPDFSGYATKAGLKCSDGRTIMPDAFKGQDGQTVPLVWMHGKSDPTNVLGHAVLENRADGVYARCFFNETPKAKHAKQIVQHKDVTQLSIYANRLQERASQVFHGVIREVSLVLAGANPGAKIDMVNIAHSDGTFEELEDEAVIHTGLTISLEDDSEVVEHAAPDASIKDVWDTMNDDQKGVASYLIEQALSKGVNHSDEDEQNNAEEKPKDKPEDKSDDNADGTADNLNHTEGTDDMKVTKIKHNVFEDNKTSTDASDESYALTHDDIKGIFADAQRRGSLKEAVEDFALEHNITNIDILFPDAKAISNTPEWIKRQTEWVAGVLSGTNHSPFSRIKTMFADITVEEARAKGYVKGTMKKEEFFALQKRVTTPCTVYKKQKLDRDDMIDITDLDVVAWLKGEMRLMLNEEIARAILIGDGRDVADEDKIQDGSNAGIGIRPIINEPELYNTTVRVNIDDANSSVTEIIDAVTNARRFYKGSGAPTFYTTELIIAKFLTARDSLNRRIYRNLDEVAAELRVSSIVAVEVMETIPDLLGIIVNLQDYTVGTTSGGEVTMFDDFDIDYNQYKYLIETRLSGALTKYKAALTIRKTTASTVILADPTAPTFNQATNVVTIPTMSNVVYKNGSGTTLTAGAQTALTSGQTLKVTAVAASGYTFPTNATDEWTFVYQP